MWHHGEGKIALSGQSKNIGGGVSILDFALAGPFVRCWFPCFRNPFGRLRWPLPCGHCFQEKVLHSLMEGWVDFHRMKHGRYIGSQKP